MAEAPAGVPPMAHMTDESGTAEYMLVAHPTEKATPEIPKNNLFENLTLVRWEGEGFARVSSGFDALKAMVPMRSAPSEGPRDLTLLLGVRLLVTTPPFQQLPELVRLGSALGAGSRFAAQSSIDTWQQPEFRRNALDAVASKHLALPTSERWREAVSTALLGDWTAPLERGDRLSSTSAVTALRAEARTLHRQLVPLWRRRTRHGRVLSLDADLGGLSLHDLVADDFRSLSHTADGVFEDERLNMVLRGLNETERQVVFAYAEGDGATWTEAATVAGADEPEMFGERVRRKAKRLAREQARRAAARHDAISSALLGGERQR
ncbi:hypothetical protein STRCI_008173 [Streptomyces cinnabarinus]|uniref:Sigma-70 family RNA polymerase sigma factor n=1 Tax=Streptomyces cinnabarinus TaxID=67287 RepID=A0ABY7KPS7_9ACTN|nr:hypothetical protein [Streptomyces cinnabarinus]WAZ26579.1 hypothetical protein STRCI_008173 [Streptomyces cinnabarinus]